MNPMNLTSGDLRAIADAVDRIDDMGTDVAVREIVVNGHTVTLSRRFRSADKQAFDHRVMNIATPTTPNRAAALISGAVTADSPSKR